MHSAVLCHADVAMAPYAAAYQATYVNGMYGNEASQPLLTDSGGFNGDMVFANRQVGLLESARTHAAPTEAKPSS